MKSILIFTCFIIFFVLAQENAQSKISDGLLECYNNTFAFLRENKLPHNMHAFIAIIRKIEDNPEVQMDLRQLSTALLHRFRQDGIVINPEAVPQEGVTPYAAKGFQFYRHAEMLKLIPGNAIAFNNNSINVIERCSLHSMISSSIEIIERDDKTSTCHLNYQQYIRRKRNDLENSIEEKYKDVETLTTEQIESIKNNNNNEENDNSFDPNFWYPALPSNHPNNTRILMPTFNKCLSESGVIKTDWGVITGGALLAGISAALQPQNIRIQDLIKANNWHDKNILSSHQRTLDNKWIATLAGDIAEVALRQGPSKESYKIGTTGHWNSSYIPKYYCLDNNQGLEFTEAEIRGDLDGLILATNVASWYSNIPKLKLSQILDMYYSNRGVFNNSINACNRRNLLTIVAPNDTISLQTYVTALVLNSNTVIPKGTLSSKKVETFSIEATNELLKFIPSSMDNDKTCIETQSNNNLFHRIAVNVTILLDTSWPFNCIKQIISLILEKLEINKYASHFKLLNAWNGNIMINTSNNILDFYEFNETTYASHVGNFNFAKSIDNLNDLKLKELDNEHNMDIGGTNSDISLIIPYTFPISISETDKQYILERIWKMREDSPDMNIIFLTARSMNNWTDFVKDPANDIISIDTEKYEDTIDQSINKLINKIRTIPKRLINSQCDSTFYESGESATFTDYLEPFGIQFYKLHPNYFYKTDYKNMPTIKIQATTGATLKICFSRNPLHENLNNPAPTCTTINGQAHKIEVNCIGANYIHECNPLYLSITANITNGELYQCQDWNHCRYPDMTNFTISYNYLSCTNQAVSITFFPILFLLSLSEISY